MKQLIRPEGSADGLAKTPPVHSGAGQSPGSGKGLRGSVVKEIIDFPGFEERSGQGRSAFAIDRIEAELGQSGT